MQRYEPSKRRRDSSAHSLVAGTENTKIDTEVETDRNSPVPERKSSKPADEPNEVGINS